MASLLRAHYQTDVGCKCQLRVGSDRNSHEYQVDPLMDSNHTSSLMEEGRKYENGGGNEGGRSLEEKRVGIEEDSTTFMNTLIRPPTQEVFKL